jgi:colanic acid/amylovoran biosynthesis glycosyltransferase
MEPPSGPRLLVLGSHWPLELFLEQLLAGLAVRGYDIAIATRRPFAHPRFRRLALPGADSRLGTLGHAPRALAAAARRPREAWKIWRRLRRESAHPWVDAGRLLPALARDFDLLYFPWNGSAGDLLPLFDLGLPTLVSCRGAQTNVSPHNPRRADLRAALPKVFAAATAVHAVSADMVEAAMAWGLDPAKATIVRPAVDLRRFPAPVPRTRAAADPLRVLAVGSLIWRKGFEFALCAVAHARRQGADVRLDVIGDGPGRERLRFTREDLGLGDAVRLRGPQPPAAVAAAFAESDAFLLSSLSEGIANVALEAMAAGLPLVATRCGGMAEVIAHDVDGLLVPTRDIEAMAEALVRLAHDPSAAARLGRAARRRAEAELGLERQVDAFDRLVRATIEAGSRRRAGG